jgi:hypothetical protein
MELIKQTFSERYAVHPIFELKLDKSLAPVATTNVPAPTSYPRPSEPVRADDAFEDVAPDKITSDVQKALKHFPGNVKKGRSS